MSEKKNIFILGYEEFTVNMLKQLPMAKNINFHPALTRNEMVSSEDIPAMEIYKKAIDIIESSNVEPDAVMTFWDFPATIVSSMLNARFGTIGPPVKSIFKCEHKGWSRSEQRKVIFDNIPRFACFDPKDEDAYRNINMLPPFWIKPVKSFRSYLSYKVNDMKEFEEYREIMKEHVDGIYHPFTKLMQKARVNDMISTSSESCIAESSLDGHMCTLEGYVYEDEVITYGIVDSIKEKGYSSFQRYQYPSQLPMEIQYKMMEVTRRIINHIGLNDTCFNIEFFYDQTNDEVFLLEINPRTSESHTDLFYKVHGQTQLRLLLDIKLGRRPRPLERKGEFLIGSKLFYRTFEPGIVTKVPTKKRIDEIIKKYPGTKIKMTVEQGDDLTDLMFKDAYSFELEFI